jgi:3-polyprenyl-4-hydroxybenzoate decarboxylase
VNHGSKGVLLGCGAPKRELKRAFEGEVPHFIRKVGNFCAGCLVVETAAFEEERDIASKVAQLSQFAEWPLIVIVDELDAAIASSSSFLWTVFTRFEPAADIYAAHTLVNRHHLGYAAPIVIDARFKPWYPAVVECDPDTARLVESRWGEYFIW